MWTFTSCRSILTVVVAGVVLLAGAASAAAPRPGGRLVIGTERDQEVYDPHRTTGITVAGVASLLYDTLLFIDYDLRTLTPGLARAWEVAPDGKTYTFQLRNDVKFHSGRRFTSADVRYTFERLLDPKTASPHRFRLASVEAIDTPGETTVVVRLKDPRSDLLAQLAHPFLGILDRESVQKHGTKYGTAGAGGTGPFTFVEWVSGDRMVFKRFGDYRWGPPFFQNKGPAFVDEVVYRVTPETQTLVFELERGNIQSLWGGRPSDVQLLRRNKDVQILEGRPNQQIQYLGFKVTRPGVSDVNVRKAISAAISKDELAKEIQRGLGTPARGVFLPVTRDYWAGQEAIFPTYAPAQSRALLDAAGWKPGPDGIRVKDGQRLALVYLSWTPEQDELATFLQSQLKEVGIDLEIRPLALAAYFSGLRKHDHDLWSLDTPYPSILEILNFWFLSTNTPAPNRAMWKDARTDELLTQARGARTDETRARALLELQKIMAENHLLVPLWHRPLLVPTRVEVKGYRPHGVYSTGYYKLLDLWIDK